MSPFPKKKKKVEYPFKTQVMIDSIIVLWVIALVTNQISLSKHKA